LYTDILSSDTWSCDILSRDILSYIFTSSLPTSCLPTFFLLLSCPVTSCLLTSCILAFCLLILCPLAPSLMTYCQIVYPCWAYLVSKYTIFKDKKIEPDKKTFWMMHKKSGRKIQVKKKKSDRWFLWQLYKKFYCQPHCDHLSLLSRGEENFGTIFTTEHFLRNLQIGPIS